MPDEQKPATTPFLVYGLDRQLKDALAAYAARTDRSMSSAARHLIRVGLDTEAQPTHGGPR